MRRCVGLGIDFLRDLASEARVNFTAAADTHLPAAIGAFLTKRAVARARNCVGYLSLVFVLAFPSKKPTIAPFPISSRSRLAPTFPVAQYMETEMFSLLRSWFGPSRRGSIRNQRIRPTIEMLETRLAPATHTWDGSESAMWSNPANWAENSAPVAGESNLVLVFSSGASTSINDLNNLNVKHLQFGGGNAFFDLSGNAITLSSGISNAMTGPGAIAAVNMNVKLTATQTFANTVSGHTILSGILSGSNALTLTLKGTNYTFAGEDSNTFAGVIKVDGSQLALDKFDDGNPVTAVAGPLVIDTTASVDSVVRLFSREQITNAARVTIGAKGQLQLGAQTETIGPLTIVGGANNKVTATGAGVLKLNGAVTVKAGTQEAIIQSPVDLGNVTRTFNVANGAQQNDLRMIGAISGLGGIIKLGAGTMTLEAANTYQAKTTVRAGVLAVSIAGGLGATTEGTSVAEGSSLRLSAHVGGEPLTLRGRGVANSGALQSVGLSQSLIGPVSLIATSTSPSVFVNTSGGTLMISGPISGNAGLTKLGGATLSFGGVLTANTYTGATFVKEGNLLLTKIGATAVPGKLIIGDGIGGASADVVMLQFNEQIANTSAVTVNASGSFNLSANAETIGPLTLVGGGISNGALTLNGNVTAAASASPAVIGATLDLGGRTRVFDVANGATADDLSVNAVIINGALTKTGAGKLVLAAANTYAGATRVLGGILNIRSNQALGAAAFGTTIANGASLQVQFSTAPIDVNGEELTLQGAGFAGGAKLQVLGGAMWNGRVNLMATVETRSIVIDIDLPFQFNFEAVVAGTAGLTKVGSGTVHFAGSSNNTYAGVTRINEGKISMLKNVGNVAIPGPIIVGDGVGEDILEWLTHEQIANTATITLNAGGKLAFNTVNETLHRLTVNGGTITDAGILMFV